MSDSGRKRPPLVAEKRHGNASGKRRKKPDARKGGPKKATPTRRNRKPTQRRSPVTRLITALWRWIWRLVWALTWRTAAVVALIVAFATVYIYTTLPDVNELLDGRARGSVTLLDHEGEVFAWRGDQFGGVVTAETVSPHLKNAVVATEDKRFYNHLGISPRGIAGAVRINLQEGRGPLSGHGGSTITQQTGKLLCLGAEYNKDQWENEAAYIADCRRTTLWRKAKEAVFALAMELKYTKNEILSVYLNRAYMGAGAYGAEAAAQRYFGKHAAEVNAAEGAMLAGLLTAPSRLAPTSGLERSRGRAAVVIGLMQDQGYLTAQEAREALDNPAELSDAAQARAGGYFADWLMSEGVPEFFGRNTTEDVELHTTLEPRIQSAAEGGLNWVFENKVREGSDAQAAVVVMSADGAVRALIGGRNTSLAGAFNRATQAKRQTGSAFKPFVYATALELGYAWNDTVVDEPYCLDIPGSKRWCPRNYTGKHYGQVTLTEALMNSLNVPAVKISEAVGRDNVRRVASDFGIESDLAAGPALALGASEASLLEMTGAYAGILNGGSSVTPYGLVELRLRGEEQPLMGSGGGIGERVISEEAARELIFMMRKVVEEGTGRRAAFPGWELAGKTGTSQETRDAWYVGFSSDYVAGVWMGYDDNTPLTGVTGSGLPAEIWREVMSRVHEGQEPRPLPAFEPEQESIPTPPDPERRRDSGLENLIRGILGQR
ncbi:penicillin-binding protein, 1A family [Salinihabitans flavidus]|uniref:peptidoglycan glycosyltransferase n=1 Tax=Salinihabitans flavidus TaxID=569882 RepID=A0A1H8UU89_9RHOB|nr:PBP1A family penicillin-binding protein [Salinihabitans flavidus]SEP06138.1 penicillin-binding protein, 1A family [Salinihabitans flavidus]